MKYLFLNSPAPRGRYYLDRCALLLTLALALHASRSLAVVIYDSGGFESPKFVVSQSLAGQDPTPPPVGYGPWHQDLGTSTAVVQTDSPNGGQQAIKMSRVAGSTGDTRWGINVPITPSPATNVVMIDFDLNATISPGTNWGGPELGPLFGVECYDSSGGTPKLIGSLFLDAYAGDVVYQQATNGTLQNSGRFIPRNEFHHYTLSANFSHKTYSIYVDGALIHTEGFVDNTATAFTDAPLTVLAATTNTAASTGTAFFDNYTISATTSRLNYLVWQGDGVTNVWDVNTSSNWFDGNGLAVFSNNVPAVFDDTGTNTPAIAVQGMVQPASILVNASQDYAIGGPGSIGGSGSLTKRGSGTLTLTGNNNFSGGIIVSNGTLMVDNATGSGTGSGPVTLATGTTLGGTGTINGSVNVANGGTISPGDAVGTLTLNGDLTLSNETVLHFNLGTSSSHLSVASNLVVNSAVNIDDAGGFGPGTYTLVSYGGTLSGPSLYLASQPSGFICNLDTNTVGLVKLLVSIPPPVPSAPTNLTATPVSLSQINLAWADTSTNETAFLIERSANNFTFTQIASTPANASSFSDTNLPSGSTFYYRIRATNPGGSSSYTGVAAATTLGAATPTGLTATASDQLVTLNWKASSGATSYNLKRSLTNGGPYTVLANLASTNYTDTAVTNGIRYYYVVSALNTDGESADSLQASALPDIELQVELKFDETSGTTAADTSGHARNGTLNGTAAFVPGISTNAVDLDGTSGYVSLPSGIFTELHDFTVATWVNLDSINMWSRVFDFGSGTTNNMFLTPLSGDGSLRFAITIGGGNSEQRINGPAPLQAGKWIHLTVTLAGTVGTLYVDGTPVGTNSSMVLYPGILGATTQNWIGRSQYADPYLNGRLDEFRIYNRALTSAEVAVLATNVPTPSAPVLAGTAKNARVDLQWTVSPGANNYNLKRSSNPGGPYGIIAANLTVTNLTDTNVVNDSTYYYVVSGVNPAGEGANSLEVSATPSRGKAVARYEFEGNANDTGGNGYNGTATSLAYVPGKIGAQAAQYDGTASFVQIPDMIGTNFTVMMWVKTTNTTAAGSQWYSGEGLLDGKAVVSAANSTLQPVADTSIQEAAPTTGRGTDTLLAMSGGGQQNIAYIRFDLSGFTSVAPGASLTLYNTTTSMTWSSTQVEIYGLLNTSGNTAQNWDENALTYSTVGAEVPGDGNVGTQDLNTSRAIFLGNLPALLSTAVSAPIAFASTNLDAFLAGRMAGNKLVTLLVVNRSASARNLIFQSRETGVGSPYTGPSLAVSGTPAQNDFGTALLGSKFAFGVGNPDTTLTTTASINDGNWHHVAASRDSAGGAIRLYVDGVLDTSATAPAGLRNAASTLRIGGTQDNSTSGFFGGTIDETRIYDRVLDDSEILTLAGRNSRISNIQKNNANVVVSGESGSPDGNYYVLTSTNLALPLPQWTCEATNRFDVNGNCVFTNMIDSSKPAKFIKLQLP